jgi:5-methylcytosine-specific restriction protein B
MSLEPEIREQLQTNYQRLADQGALLSASALQAAYSRFRARFGPDVLSHLDGEDLLDTMHRHGSQDSLVYWLEFKNDDELPAVFGSIAGGSALKFGLYNRKETGEWMSGSSQQQRVLTLPEAVALARKHRDELLAGTHQVEALPPQPTLADYRALQAAMDRQAPTVSRLAWGHKYFSLLFPDRLDDYHSSHYQRFHLMKLLQEPPPIDERYVAAWHFLSIAGELGWPVNHLSTVLNDLHGDPYRVWAIQTRPRDTDLWPLMQAQGALLLDLPDMSSLEAMDDSKGSLETLKEQLTAAGLADDQDSRLAAMSQAIRQFVRKLAERDLVLAMDGETVRGIARVGAAPYRFDAAAPPSARHQRPIEWIDSGDWTIPVAVPTRPGVTPISAKNAAALIAVERRLLSPRSVAPMPPPTLPHTQIALPGLAGEIQAILERKGQVILYGPPGTGKTWHARSTARELAALHAFGQSYAALSAADQARIDGDVEGSGLVRVCTFHPAYGYEDFLEGYRPHNHADGQLGFVLRDGLFKHCCQAATAAPQQRFYLLIDEINRGDIPRIFGELLTLLELDKRGDRVTLPLSGTAFTVPPNLYLIGTMNTADRSIALLDTALRRRFGFLELMPDTNLLHGAILAQSIPLGAWLASLNARIVEHIGRDARNLQIGHAYFLRAGKPITDLGAFMRVLSDEIVPLLEEYAYEDFELIARLLGPGFIDMKQRRIRRELFHTGRKEDFIQALLALTPELTTSSTLAGQVADDDLPDEEEAETEDQSAQ